MSHTKVYDPYVYADGVNEPRVVSRYSCQECDCEWPCEESERPVIGKGEGSNLMEDNFEFLVTVLYKPQEFRVTANSAEEAIRRAKEKAVQLGMKPIPQYGLSWCPPGDKIGRKDGVRCG